MSKIFIVLTCLVLVSCGSSIESPVLYFSDASPQPVKNIECNWNGNILGLGALNPGDTRSHSFFISGGDSQFFGPVSINWINAKGDRVSKSFNFKKENMPSIKDKTTYNYVQLYFDQEDMEIITSDAADLSGKVRRMDQMMNKYHDDFLRSGVKASFCANNDMNICQNADNSGLIVIKRKQLEPTPGTF